MLTSGGWLTLQFNAWVDLREFRDQLGGLEKAMEGRLDAQVARGDTDKDPWCRRSDLRRLLGTDGRGWVSGDAMAVWMDKVSKSAATRCHVFDGLLYLRLRKKEEGKVGELREHKTLLARLGDGDPPDRILAPCHVKDNHWVLAVVDVSASQLEYYDPLRGTVDPLAGQVLSTLAQYTERVWKEAGKPLNDKKRRWKEVYPAVPRQKNGRDCGVFTMLYAKCVAEASKLGFAFSPEEPDTQAHRLRLARVLLGWDDMADLRLIAAGGGGFWHSQELGYEDGAVLSRATGAKDDPGEVVATNKRTEAQCTRRHLRALLGEAEGGLVEDPVMRMGMDSLQDRDYRRRREEGQDGLKKWPKCHFLSPSWYPTAVRPEEEVWVGWRPGGVASFRGSSRG